MKPWEIAQYTPTELEEMTDVLEARAQAQKKAEQEARRRTR